MARPNGFMVSKPHRWYKIMNIDLDIHSLDPKKFQEFTAVDIREPEETESYGPDTKNIEFIPLSQLQEKIDYFTKDHNYLLVCAKGGRSHYLAEILQSRGIHALSVNNGMIAFNQYLSDHGFNNA